MTKMYEINETHDPNLKSWVESANEPDTDFPIQNLPFCNFWKNTAPVRSAAGIIIGHQVLDLGMATELKLFDKESQGFLLGLYTNGDDALQRMMEERTTDQSIFRRRVSDVLSDKTNSHIKEKVSKCLYPASSVQILLPTLIGDYTDFYCSIYHATNVGSMFRPDNPLLPNYKYVPIGYHGRASSIVISGTDIKRPHGQNRSDQDAPPVFIPCKSLDYEMEVGFFVGQGNELGAPIPIAEAEKHIFGLCL